jgi:hypothetical protein
MSFPGRPSLDFWARRIGEMDADGMGEKQANARTTLLATPFVGLVVFGCIFLSLYFVGLIRDE